MAGLYTRTARWRARVPSGPRTWVRWILSLMLGVIVPAHAETYRWLDAQGRVVFGDRPPPGVEAVPVAPRAVPSPLTPEEAAQQVQQLRAREAARNAEAAGAAAQAARDKAAQAAADQARDARCAQARWALSALESGRPVYRDEQGMYRIKRPPGHTDTYTGRREYLDDTARAAEIGRQQAALRSECGRLPTPDERAATAEEIRRAEDCEAAAADLAHKRRSGSHATADEIAALQRYLDSNCAR